jgi:hypothetical protein
MERTVLVTGNNTLSSAQIPLSKLSIEISKKMLRYDAIPASGIGRPPIHFFREAPSTKFDMACHSHPHSAPRQHHDRIDRMHHRLFFV